MKKRLLMVALLSAVALSANADPKTEYRDSTRDSMRELMEAPQFDEEKATELLKTEFDRKMEYLRDRHEAYQKGGDWRGTTKNRKDRRGEKRENNRRAEDGSSRFMDEGYSDYRDEGNYRNERKNRRGDKEHRGKERDRKGDGRGYDQQERRSFDDKSGRGKSRSDRGDDRHRKEQDGRRGVKERHYNSNHYEKGDDYRHHGEARKSKHHNNKQGRGDYRHRDCYR